MSFHQSRNFTLSTLGVLFILSADISFSEEKPAHLSSPDLSLSRSQKREAISLVAKNEYIEQFESKEPPTKTIFSSDQPAFSSGESPIRKGTLVGYVEGFEGDFPGNIWFTGDDNPLNGTPSWSPVGCKAFQGGKSAWCAEENRTGASCSEYADEMDSFLYVECEYGGLSTNETNKFYYTRWVQVEEGFDYFGYLVEGFKNRPVHGGGIPDATFLFQLNGNTDGWESRVVTLGSAFDMTPFLRITFMFHSDGSVTDEGAYLDEIDFNARSDNRVFPIPAGFAPPSPTPSPTGPTATPTPTPCRIVLVSDSFNRPDADRCNLGQVDLAFGGTGDHFYIPIWPGNGVDSSNPIGADLVDEQLMNNGMDFGGVAISARPNSCSDTSVRGEDLGQDLMIHLEVLVPTDNQGDISRAGPFFRARSMARGDGLYAGTNAGYWVQLLSTGQIVIMDLNSVSAVASSAPPGVFDPTVFHTLDVAVEGSGLEVVLDGARQSFLQDTNLVTTVTLPQTSASNQGVVGIAFSAESNRGLVGGQRADNLIVAAFCQPPPGTTFTPTGSPTITLTDTRTPVFPPTSTDTPTPTSTFTPSFTTTFTDTPTSTLIPGVSTQTPTFTPTLTPSPSFTNTPITYTPTPFPTCVPVCPTPLEPSDPEPADGATGVSTEPDLTWKRTVFVSSEKPIYGTDDRRDLYQVADPLLRTAADSTAAFFRFSRIDVNDNGTVTIHGHPTLNEKFGGNLCPDEPFRNQPAGGFCSGFLVAPDLVATAGHCVKTENDCENTVVVFGYHMLDASTARLTVPIWDVYLCEGIVARENANQRDWAVIQLDREVDCRVPLDIRRSGKIRDDEDLVIIGHPKGLPKKIAGGAKVRDNSNPNFFVSNLDSYSGNSGSPVFNAHTLCVEGILVRGESDFVVQGGCRRSRVCPDNGCRGEDSTRTTLFDEHVPTWTEYELWFGKCEDSFLNLIAITDGTTYSLTGLEPDTEYCWQIVAVNDCGVTDGPVWTFRTGGEHAPTRTQTPTATPTPTCPEYECLTGDRVLVLLRLFREGKISVECLLRNLGTVWCSGPTVTPHPTDTPGAEPSDTETPLPTPTETVPFLDTPTATPTFTDTPTNTPTPTVTDTPTDTPTATCAPNDPNNPIQIVITKPTETSTDQRVISVEGKLTDRSGSPINGSTIVSARLLVNGDSQSFSVNADGTFVVPAVILRHGNNTIAIEVVDNMGRRGCAVFQIESTTPQTSISVTLTWNLGSSDVDLYVTQPDGETAWYNHLNTSIGGRLDVDNTFGFGPENYFLSKEEGDTVLAGSYRVRVHYFDDKQDGGDPPVPTRTVGWTVVVILNEGTEFEQRIVQSGSLSTAVGSSNASPGSTGPDWAEVGTFNPCPPLNSGECNPTPTPNP